MLKQVAGLMALALSSSFGRATGLPGQLLSRSDDEVKMSHSIRVSWALEDVGFILGQNTTVTYNVSLPTAQSESSEMYFFLCKTTSATSVTSANTVEVLRIPGR